MKILNWWPLFFLLLIPIIIFMYLLKQKAVEKEVSSLYLFREMYSNIEANTPWEKLKKNWLMILQIITTLVLIFALMSPVLLNKGVGADHVAIVIDNSAGMQASYSDSQTRLDYAKEQAQSLVKGLRSGTSVSLITSASSATLLISSSDDKNQIVKKIEEIEQTNFEGSADAGIDMVLSMKSQWESLETVCFTDTSVYMQNLDGYIVDTYAPCKNVGIDYLSHGFSNNKLVVLAKVSNYSDEEVNAEVSLYGDDILQNIKNLTIAANSSEIIYFDELDFNGNVLRAELSGVDDLRSDNISYDIMSEDDETDILLMTDANVFLENALGLMEGINVTKSGDIYSFDTFASQDYDVYIFDSMIPGQLPSEGNIIIFNAPYPDLYSFKENIGDVNIEAVEHDITTYMEGFTFGASNVYSLEVPFWAKPFLTSGTDTVAFSGESNGQMISVLGFDLHNSDLALKMEFPLMIYNMITQFSENNLVKDTVVSAGNSVGVNAQMEGTLPKVKKPDETESELSDYRMNYTSTDQLGVYTVSQEVDGFLQSAYFAVNFPNSESKVDVIPTSLDTEKGEEVKSKVGGTLNLRTLIIIISLGLLGVEWIAYLKR